MARQEISTVDEEHDVVFEALERALRMLRSRLPKKAEQKHSSTILSACSPLLPLAGALAADIAAYEAHEWPQHDGDTREHEKAEVSITYRIRVSKDRIAGVYSRAPCLTRTLLGRAAMSKP